MGLLESYQALVQASALKPDDAQVRVLAEFERLSAEINASGHGRLNDKPRGLLSRIFTTKPEAPPKGLYIWGEVGRGKTFMMDLFFNTISEIPKRRVHFHAFMQDVHAKRAANRSDDIIGQIADDLSSLARLLCLDEMQISDIADAMIIGRLFEALNARGVCIVTTSNLPPAGLYKDGLNRQLFLPFIAWMNANLEVIHLADGLDYRLGRMAARQHFMALENASEMNGIWNELTDHSAGESVVIEILGRKLVVPSAARGCARFGFDQLCENPLGAADYLALARNFHAVFIDGIPIFKASQRNEAKRFILMIDTFYDAGTKLVATAAANPEGLYPAGPHKPEFARTISRLQEMQSASWWNKPPKPLEAETLKV